MTSEDDQRRTAAQREDAMAQAIRIYLREHPTAKDTREGILNYWLTQPRVAGGEAVLRTALRRLVQEGFLREERRAGRVYYALAQGN